MAHIKYSNLPTTLYKVRVPKIALYSPEELEYFGMPVSVINRGEKIKKYSNEETICYLKIEQMIDIFRQGYRIELLVDADFMEIYNALERFLRDTQSSYIENLNRKGYEVEDSYLADIDRFASEMFGLNRYEIVDEKVNKPMKQFYIMELPDFTGTVKRQSNGVNFAKPSNTTMSDFVQPVSSINGYQQQYSLPITSTQPVHNSFPYNPRVDNEPDMAMSDIAHSNRQTGYIPRYNPVRSTVGSEDVYTDYYHSNMPTVDPSKVKRNSVKTYSSIFNSKG